MIYSYFCDGCSQKYEVVKPISEFENEEHCPLSATTMTRVFVPSKIYLSGTGVQEKKWQPALGRAATDNELKAHAKAQGWQEIGNERPEKHLKPERTEYPDFSNDDIQAISRQLTP